MTDRDYGVQSARAWEGIARSLNRELKTVKRRVEAVKRLHRPSNDNWCEGCALNYPCPTIRALRGSDR